MASDRDPALARNAAANIGGEALWGFGFGIIAPATVLVTYLQRHGAGEGTAGVIASMEGGSNLLQLLGPWLLRSHRRRKRQLLIWHFLTVLPAMFALAALAAWGGGMSDTALRLSVLAVMGVFYASIGTIVGVWVDWFAHLFDANVRGTVSGMVWAAMSGAIALGGITASRVLAHGASDGAYATIFLIGAVAASLGIIAYGLVRDPAEHAEEAEPPRGRALLARMALSLREPRVRALLLARVLGNSAFAAVPFLALLFSSRAGGGLDASTLAIGGVCLTAGSALASLAFGRLGDRAGHRHGLIAAFPLAIAGLAVADASAGLTSCVLAYGLIGLGAGAWMASGYLVHETTPHDSRLAHLIGCNTVQAGFGLLVPLGWGWLAAHVGIGAMLVSCIAAALAGLAWSLLAVPEPRASGAPRLAA